MENQEIEIKFYVQDLNRIKTRVEALGGKLVQPRVLEINLRYDTTDGLLAKNFQVLRLRRDTESRLTFKGPAQMSQGVRVRQEIEFVVDDFEKANLFLTALGYQTIMIYEKFRTVYDLDLVHVTLDEMPYGEFVELEGPDVPTLKSVNEKLGLNWAAGAPASYTMLFEIIRQKMKLSFRDLTFENFETLTINPDDLGVVRADDTKIRWSPE